MQLLQPRQIDILDIARRDGRVEVDDLANVFGVTPQTIRKDLNELCDLKAAEGPWRRGVPVQHGQSGLSGAA